MNQEENGVVNPGEYDLHMGLKIGSILPLEETIKISLDGVNDVGLSILVSGFMDAKIGSHFSIGGFLTYFRTEFQAANWPNKWGSLCYISCGGRLRARFSIGDEIEIRPGISLGFGMNPCFTTDEDADGANGPTIGASIEIAYYLRRHLGLLFDIGIIYYGGDGGFTMHHGDWDEGEHYSIIFAPVGYIALGVEYGGFCFSKN